MASKVSSRTVKSLPSKSALATALAKGKATPGRKAIPSNVHKAEFGGPAHGTALALAVIKEATEQGAAWRTYFAKILETDPDARKAFRKAVNENKKAATAQDKAAGTSMTRSALVRISECITVSKAGDRGLTMENVVEMWNAKGVGEKKTAATVPHAFIVEAARRWRDSHDENGVEITVAAGTARGRKALTPTEKARRYMLNNFAPKDFPKIAALVADFAKRIKTAKDLSEELAKSKPTNEQAPARAAAAA